MTNFRCPETDLRGFPAFELLASFRSSTMTALLAGHAQEINVPRG
jgi:hypothetical protein